MKGSCENLECHREGPEGAATAAVCAWHRRILLIEDAPHPSGVGVTQNTGVAAEPRRYAAALSGRILLHRCASQADSFGAGRRVVSGSYSEIAASRSSHWQTMANAASRSRPKAFIKYGTAPYMLLRPLALSWRRYRNIDQGWEKELDLRNFSTVKEFSLSYRV